MYKAILIDCFDTIIIRNTHPFMILKAWAVVLSKHYPISCGNIDLTYSLRLKLQKKHHDVISILEELYQELNVAGSEKVSKKEFIVEAHRLEVLCECSSHYLNRGAEKVLKDAKKRNIPVYCVSDFHLTKEDLCKFFNNLSVNDCITDIFVSSEYQKTKATGELYKVVLDKLSLSAKDVLMIGDNRQSDIKSARLLGIQTAWCPNFLKKKYLKVEKIKRPYSLACQTRKIRKENCKYEEYVAIFYIFIARLYNALKANETETVVFLAREGAFLKKLFDLYQLILIPKESRIETKYFKCSRRAIFSVQKEKRKPETFHDISLHNYLRAIGFDDHEIDDLPLDNYDVERVEKPFFSSESYSRFVNDEEMKARVDTRIIENEAAFSQYLYDTFDLKKKNSIVDVGWSGRMQFGIEEHLATKLQGYYLGITDDCSEKRQPCRHGLVFEYIDGKYSNYFGILRANTILYELLLAAPHGSAQNYRFSQSGKAIVSEAWATNERLLYEKHICSIQQKMEQYFANLCFFERSDSSEEWDRIAAKLVLKDALLPTVSRVKFMEILNQGFSQNFGQQTERLTFSEKVSISWIELMKNPQNYVRYVAKLPVVFMKKGLLPLYYPIGAIYYVITLAKSKLFGI